MQLHPMKSLSLALLLAPAAAAQDLTPKAAPQSAPILLRGATVHTVSGDVIERGDVLFDDGILTAVGKATQLPEGTEVVDLAGQHVYPGFVLVASILGLTEVESVDMTIDTSEAGSMNPEVYAAVGVNPDSWWLPVARRNGILTAGVMPRGGRIPGRASAMRLDGWTWEDMAIERDAGLVMSWPFMGGGGGRFRRFGGGGGDPSAQIAELDVLLDAAQAYHEARAADPTIGTDIRLEALGTTLRGERPVFIEATTQEQIESAVTWAVGRGVVPVIVGGRDAARCIPLLKRHHVMVALTGTHRLPHRRDLSFASTYELPVQLEEAGVRWCLTMRTTDSSNARNLPYEAAACVGYGLAREAALRSITLSAAEALGVADRLGSLDVGKAATLMVCDGDPLELTTRITHAFIDGRAIDLRDKQTELFEKYRERYRQLGRLSGDE